MYRRRCIQLLEVRISERAHFGSVQTLQLFLSSRPEFHDHALYLEEHIGASECPRHTDYGADRLSDDLSLVTVEQPCTPLPRNAKVLTRPAPVPPPAVCTIGQQPNR